MADSRIDWTDKVWNPTTGCTKGCSYCYARTMAHRLQLMGQEKYKNGFDPAFHPDELQKPLHWEKPCRVFVNSMGDLFDPAIPYEFIVRVLAIIARCPQHTFQILTKMPRRMREFFAGVDIPANLWLGVTVEDQAAADLRLPVLLAIPAGVRFVSIEPMTGPVDLAPGWGHLGTGPIDGLHWVIAGGMTGSDAVPMHPEWVRSLRDQCRAASVPFFFKQWGEWLPQCNEPFRPRKYLFLNRDGRIDRTGDSVITNSGWSGMGLVGKKAAGSMIDGQEWKQFPEGK